MLVTLITLRIVVGRNMKVAFVGLGVMGYPMAGHLQRGGHQVTVYNRSVNKAKSWVDQYRGESALTPKLAAHNAELIFICVGNDEDLRSVVLGADGALAGAAEGSLIIDHTTASAAVARELAVLCADKQVGFMDAPVSGGQAGAENGALTVMMGGCENDFLRAKPVIDSYARSIKCLGEVGQGQLCKMVNQICIAGIVQGLAEGLHFARAAGLNQADVVEVISKGAAQSWQMENRYKTMIAGDYEHGFAVDWMRKDLGIVLDEARSNGARLPIAALVDQFYGEVQDLGGSRWDTSSLLARLEQNKKS